MIKIDEMNLVGVLENIQLQVHKDMTTLRVIDQMRDRYSDDAPALASLSLLYDDVVDGLKSINDELLGLTNALAIEGRKQKQRQEQRRLKRTVQAG